MLIKENQLRLWSETFLSKQPKKKSELFSLLLENSKRSDYRRKLVADHNIEALPLLTLLLKLMPKQLLTLLFIQLTCTDEDWFWNGLKKKSLWMIWGQKQLRSIGMLSISIYLLFLVLLISLEKWLETKSEASFKMEWKPLRENNHKLIIGWSMLTFVMQIIKFYSCYYFCWVCCYKLFLWFLFL